MGAKRRRHPGGCSCDRCLANPRVAFMQLDPLDELDQEMRNLRELDAAAFYDPDEVNDQCR